RKRVCLLAPPLAKRVPAANVNGNAPAQVRQREVHTPVAAKGCAEQAEEPLVLVDRQELPVAQAPATRRIAQTHDPDFRQKWFCHSSLLKELTAGSKL